VTERSARRGADARAVAVDALVRIDHGAYANLVLPRVLERSGLAPMDRRFATELVYGTTRMRRSCDWLVDRFLTREPDPVARAALRLGAYQLEFLRTPPHAAVGATVAAAPARARGLVNAVLRKVATAGHPGDDGAVQGWPGVGVRLSYPDWIVERLVADLGSADATAALEAMDRPPPVTQRDDGYTQDQASQWVAEAVGAGPGDLVADLCAAPGGKATAMARSGAALVVGGDRRPTRAALIAANAARVATPAVAVVVADGRRPPLRAASLDRVLVDAPCSGLGVLRRRADARWRMTPDEVPRLAQLQRELLDAAAGLTRRGGLLAYSVCTMTAAETTGVDAWLSAEHPEMVARQPPGPPWEPAGRGARLLPQSAGTDGMFLLLLERRAESIRP